MIELIVLTEDLVRNVNIAVSKLIVLTEELVRICQYSCVEADCFESGFSTHLSI